MAVSFVEVTEEFAGQRLDNFLLARLKGVPRSKIYNIIRRGEVRVNKGRVKPTYRVRAGDSVRIPPINLPEKQKTVVSAGLRELLLESILFEDGNWLVVNKPGGLAVHGGSGISAGLIESLRLIRPDCRHLELCHRIDRDTSGCVVLAKKRSALRRFHQALREKQLSKCYLALVSGRWPAKIDAVNKSLEKNVLTSGERMVRVADEGKTSLTRFSIIDKFDGYTLIEARPVTGRTHQIRVHCQAVGHAIVGDQKYGHRDVNQAVANRGFKQLFLHAHSINLPATEDDRLLSADQWPTVRADYPASWQQFLSSVR